MHIFLLRDIRLRLFLLLVALLTCGVVAAQEASLVGAWQFNTRELTQQLELDSDGSYRRHIVTTGSRRIEVGRWRSEVSLLVLLPDHVITAQGARVPLPPRERLIDVAGVDQHTLTLYYDGDALETWQRRESPGRGQRRATERNLSLPADHVTRQRTRRIAIRAPQPSLAQPLIEAPLLPSFQRATAPEFVPASATVVVPPLVMAAVTPPLLVIATETAAQPRPAPHVPAIPASPPPAVATPAGLYDEQQVAALITQLACDQLRYPQRANTIDVARQRQMAIDAGMTPFDATRLARTLRHYQSNAAFMHRHQAQIAERSMACVLAREQVSALP